MAWTKTCPILLPTFDHLLTPHEESLACKLADFHEGAHVALLPSGSFIAWEPDEECLCGQEGGEEDYEPCECFVYEELSHYEAAERIAQSFAQRER
jgi:hypothetical protein